ncbi:MAG: 50S ribosomal protein L2 [Spirochaetes bacterium GWD1_27_9]|nr:MAG: 50S ribosomal protein L2 [Spirochaetes bacterium GWB1_27_13]OHD21023.1 MAG: 50S ribosomal protein L2 [Spirochaetes bacterium GWC1_27_15]OHD45384.1 MAG: 50S ribosomal protein L2 [Spirochaetes bacterium GWD1_27_9]
MSIKKYKPITPSLRELTVLVNKELSENSPLKSLTKGKRRSNGRARTGRISVRHIGGGHKQKFRTIDFCRDKYGIEAKVASIEYDPNRTANIALLFYKDGEKRYIISPEGLKVGDILVSGEKEKVKIGNAMKIKNIPVGTIIHNIELEPGKGSQIARSAGSFAQISGFENKKVILKMPSGEIRYVNEECFATIGQVGNLDHNQVCIGKAGRSRWLGVRPKVRGTAMNPVDHPHGGGEGRTKGGRHPVSPWGLPTKGYKTRNKRKSSSNQIIRRRK